MTPAIALTSQPASSTAVPSPTSAPSRPARASPSRFASSRPRTDPMPPAPWSTSRTTTSSCARATRATWTGPESSSSTASTARYGRGVEYRPPPSRATVTHANITVAALSGYRPVHLDLHLPPHADGPYPVVVWIHGGGWREGSRLELPESIAPFDFHGR